MKRQSASTFIMVLLALMSLFLLTACPSEKHQSQQISEEEGLMEDEEVFEEDEEEDFYEVAEDEEVFEVEPKDSLDLGML